MRLEQLHYFIEIAKYRSLSAASEHLHISQQALGAAIKNLEQEIGVTLLVRTPRGVYLTDEGKVLAQGANGILNDIEQLVLSIQEPNTYEKKDQVRIGASFGTLETFLSDNLAQLLKENQKLKIHVQEIGTADMYRGLMDDQLDFGMVSYDAITGLPPCLDEENIQIIPMFNSKLCIRVSKYSHLANYQSISLRTALKESILVYCPQAWENNPILQTIRGYQDNCQVIIQENYQLHHQMLANGLGISFAAYIGRGVDKNDPQICYIPIKENIEVTNAAVINKQCALRPNVTYILNYLQMQYNSFNDFTS